MKSSKGAKKTGTKTNVRKKGKKGRAKKQTGKGGKEQ
jgi:hypothetical protein